MMSMFGWTRYPGDQRSLVATPDSVPVERARVSPAFVRAAVAPHVPAIDAAVPETLLTATFAAG